MNIFKFSAMLIGTIFTAATATLSSSFITSMVLFGIGTLFIFIYSIYFLITNYKKNKKPKYKSIKTLKDHVFFIKVDRFLNYHLRSLPIKHKYKKEVAQTFLIIMFSTFKFALEKCVGHILAEPNKFTIYIFQNYLQKVIKFYEEEMKRVNIPSIFIKKFNESHGDYIEATIMSLLDIFENEWYTTLEEKMSAMLDMMSYNIMVTFINAKKSMDSFNGDLEKEVQKSKFKEVNLDRLIIEIERSVKNNFFEDFIGRGK